ncbi:protein kinase [Luteolibacter pohnpeiensis]|uniref:Protein kinase n=1 Tax=Luteolibacter pohnpeiensis TaxID=454153 RepID=A0A934SAD0_9BACT|nr:protein kinase [Luteolibacter pohnpeiensis]MBK1882249.1 protein kinase [Luteolibacter pohnpeiensis]
MTQDSHSNESNQTSDPGLPAERLLDVAMDSKTRQDGPEPIQQAPLSPQELAEKLPQFEITECLGRGGMGVVYKARQKALNRWVAIKILAGERQSEPGFSAFFEFEAQTLAKLNHPNIVTIHDFGVADDLYYLVMEFVDGMNLRDVMRDGKISPEQALAIVPPICDALQMAHTAGVIHRDIKPENILLDRDGRVKIADFGIAKLAGSGTGMNAGTPPYMAPEQYGEANGVDHRADIYSLGVLFYEMLTGQHPDGPFGEKISTSGMDPKISSVVSRALRSEPEKRFQTAADFKTEVEACVSPEENALPPATPPPLPPAKKKGLFGRWWWLLLVGLILGPIFGIAVAGMATYFMPKTYESFAVIELHLEHGFPTSKEFETFYQVLQSKKSLGEVSDRLKMDQYFGKSRAQTIPLLKTLIHFDNIRGTDLVSIRARCNDAELAKQLAETFTQVAQQRARELPWIREIQIDEQPAVPRSSVSPNQFLNLALGGVLGLVTSPLLMLIFAGILEFLFPQRKALA